MISGISMILFIVSYEIKKILYAKNLKLTENINFHNVFLQLNFYLLPLGTNF